MSVKVVPLLLLLVCMCGTVSLSDVSSTKFADKLMLLRERELGVLKMQNIIDNFDAFESEPVDVKSDLTEIERKLALHFSKSYAALDRLITTLKRLYNDRSFEATAGSDFTQCCNVSNTSVTYNYLYKQKVDTTSMCYRLGNQIKNRQDSRYMPVPISDDLIKVFKYNAEKFDLLKWQFFGTSKGQTIMYPGNYVTDCTSYDNRMRPWYRHAVNPRPKDIVIAIDYSSKMALHLNVTKQSVIAAINILMPRDRMALLLFNKKETRSPSGCTTTRLTFATDNNKRRFIAYVEEMSPSDSQDYMAGLNKSFDFLDETSDTSKAILLISDDGGNSVTRESILNLIGDRNGLLRNAVTMFTYLVGPDMNKKSIFLTQIANQTNSDKKKGPIQKGLFNNIEKGDEYAAIFAQIYSHLTITGTEDNTIITHPYSDFFGLGDVITIGKSFYMDNALIGTAGVDVKLSDIAADVIFYDGGQNSYAFIFDSTKRTVIHPLVPSNRQMYRDFSDINAFENQLHEHGLIRRILISHSGSFQINITIPLSRGNPHKDGVTSLPISLTYSYKPITGTHYTLVIATPSDGKRLVQVKPEGSYKIDEFYYHRLDLYSSLAGMCRLNTNPGTTNHSTVKFNGNAFIDSVKYFNVEENRDTLQDYKDFMHGLTISDQNLKNGIRAMVNATAKMDKFWKQTKFDESIQKYIGLKDGVFRIYPGQILANEFDHTQRIWYEAAIARPNQNVFSSPYTDSQHSGVVLTLSSTLHERRSVSTIIGVMGMDFKISRIHNFLKEAYLDCKKGEYSCFIIDDNGYLIFHESFHGASNDKVQYMHITQLEPDIASYLIKNNYMTGHQCVDLNTTTVYNSYKMTDKLKNSLQSNLLNLVVEPIPNSNIFVGISHVHILNTTCHSCEKLRGGQISMCRDDIANKDRCRCPCRESADFNRNCTNKLTPISIARCTVLPPILGVTAKTDDRYLKLKSCYTPNCEQYGLRDDCSKLIDCEWCLRSQFKPARCAFNDTCFSFINPDPPTSFPTSAIIGMATGFAVLGIVASVGFAFFFTKYRKKQEDIKNSTTDSDNDHPYYNRNINQPKKDRVAMNPDVVPKINRGELPPTPDEAEQAIYSDISTVNDVYKLVKAPSETGWSGQRNMGFDTTYGGSIQSYRSMASNDNFAERYLPPPAAGGGRPASEQTRRSQYPTPDTRYNNSLPGAYHNGVSPYRAQEVTPSSHFDKFESNMQDHANSPYSRGPPPSNPTNIAMTPYPVENLPPHNISQLYAPKLVKTPSSLGSYI